MEHGLVLVLGLVIILTGAEVFTNGVEWLGKRLCLDEGAVGSVLAAVGTALPETLIPLIAIIFTPGATGAEIGVGAILGAPLMLSTLAMFVTGCAVLSFQRRRPAGALVTADPAVVTRDLGFFLILFTAAVLVGMVPGRRWQLIIAGFMVFSYLYYLYVTLGREEGIEQDLAAMRRCYFSPGPDMPRLWVIVLQVLAALALIVLGADLFVDGVKGLAAAFALPAFVLAMVIAPVATELPEKFNSVLWVARGKDTLALGNITGAMAFQSSLIPALGIFLTDWRLGPGAVAGAGITLAAATALYLDARCRHRVDTRVLLAGGGFYLLFLVLVLRGIIR
ncbi:MAG: sodium:calcium antiporter [Syntrophomonadaceae bacterium]|jgi:cation:H+ antiporter|nr:sodium:calcium antiporter [Syntrophomonadaceae bacterium]MDH7497691.1 sodium:calcium antiporter [Syntrophomonadaceae bacterium]